MRDHCGFQPDRKNRVIAAPASEKMDPAGAGNLLIVLSSMYRERYVQHEKISHRELKIHETMISTS